MRRIVLMAAAAIAAAALLAAVSLGSEPEYEVRAYFDTAGFLVTGEEVRVAGARVGTVTEVDVARPAEPVHADGSPEPGEAVAVLEIEDPAFRDFRADAFCLIRPQSLLGEKFVECTPTRPRAAASEPPPPLSRVPEGEEGAGQAFLPLERTGKAVDLDLVQNIMDRPYPDRFRLILNDLGAGLAARGEDLAKTIERASPALRRTDQVLAILERQRDQLGRLAADSDAILAPLARERASLSGFIGGAGRTASAAAERAAELSEGIERLPAFLAELRSTMVQLRRFADQATPVVSDLGTAAPSVVRSSRALGPFADAAEGSLVTLGEAAARAGPDLVRSEPFVDELRRLAERTRSPAVNLARLLRSLRRTGGYQRLTELILNSSGSVNGFDRYGHYLRTLLLVTNCVDYVTAPLSGCSANWQSATTVSRGRAAGRTGLGDVESLLGFVTGEDR